ncbi:hypothetical protein L2E82_37519 [Cichorium intybus]|uniref:Uncharacterized protein n=1 Tax=Cichorium intybus TaxID=13427 RepID=A0ACB9AEF3_CICIN|nr:hypothetical protein L2E82_37519 [Cichorium intybus]
MPDLNVTHVDSQRETIGTSSDKSTTFVLDRGDVLKPKIMDKKAKCNNNPLAKNKPTSIKMKYQFSPRNSVNSTSAEIQKTIEIGKEIGFQLQNVEELLRAEIEGEGVINNLQ